MKRALAILVLTATLAGPVAASSEASPTPEARAMIAARQRFFGKENVNPRTGAVRADRVILSWFSVSSFAASLNGHVVLLDAWIARGSHSGYVPTTPEEVAALQPEYIFIGHGDFDHEGDAAEIALLTGATLVGAPEHCDSLSEQAGEKLTCVAASPPGLPLGNRKELELIPGVEITAVTHIHSSVEPPELNPERLPCPPLWNALDTAEHPPSSEDFMHLMTHLGDTRGGNILYQFRIGNFSFVHHDTVGKIDDNPLVTQAIRSLPPTDVEFGAILAFGQATNCFRSLGLYIRALEPTVFAAMHQDNFTFFLGANAKDLEPYVRDELARLPKKVQPELIYGYDPDDYINPALYTFDPSESRWK